PDLDEDPAALAGAGQCEATGELAAVRREGQRPRLVPGVVGGAPFPDVPGPAPRPGIGGHAPELPRFQRGGLDRPSDPPDRGGERWAAAMSAARGRPGSAGRSATSSRREAGRRTGTLPPA